MAQGHISLSLFLSHKACVSLVGEEGRLVEGRGDKSFVVSVSVLGPTVHPGLPLEVLFGVGRCYRL
jgi:hypothetical protein